MPTPSSFIPDSAPASFQPDAPASFIADEAPTATATTPPPETATEHYTRLSDDLTSGDPARQAKAALAITQSLGTNVETLWPDMGSPLRSKPTSDIPTTASTPSIGQMGGGFAPGTDRPDYGGPDFHGILPRPSTEMSGFGIPHPSTKSEKLLAGTIGGVEDLIEGVATYLASPQGVAELGLSKTPLAPAVYLKWANDMVRGGMMESGEAYDAYKRGDTAEFGRHVIGAVGMFLGAGGAVKGGVGHLEKTAEGFVPRGQGIASPELQQLAPLTAAEVSKPTEVKNAREITETTSVPELGVRPRVGEETPLRQPGETPETSLTPATDAASPITSPETQGTVTAAEASKPADTSVAKTPPPPVAEADIRADLVEQGISDLPVEQQAEVRQALEKAKRLKDLNPREQFLLDELRKWVNREVESPASAPAVQGEGKQAGQTGLGAAVPAEFEPARKFTTKTTVEQINKERKERGLGPLEEHEVFGNKQAVAEAKKILAENPDAPEQILARLREKPETTLEPTERAVMVIHRAELLNSYYRALKNWREHFEGDDFVRAAQEAEIADFYSKKLAETESLVSEGGAGTAAGRSLQAIKMGIAEDYSLDMMTLKRMKAKGEALTPEEGAAVIKEHEELKARIKELEAELKKENERGGSSDSQDAVDDAVKVARARQKKDKASGAERDLTAEQADVLSHLKDRFIETGDLAGEETSIRKLMELLVEREGITERLPMETRVHDILQREVDPTITREQAMDLMSKYGQSKLPSPEFAKKTVRDIVAQILSVRKLLDYFKGERPKLTGQLRDAPSDVQRGLIKMVNEAKKAFKLEGPTDNARAIKSALDAINTRLKNRIADLKQEIATRQKIIRERQPSPYNSETLRMRAEIEELEKVHKEIFGKKELTDAQRLELLEKSADRQIAELERQLRTGEIFPKSKIPFTGESAKLKAARSRLEELKATREFAREALQPRPEAEAASVESRVKSLDRQIAELEKQIADEAVFSKGKTAKEPSTDARVLEREKRLADLKEQRQFIRERIQPKPEQAARELEQRAESLRKKIEEVQRQIRDGDIFPKGKKLTEVEKNDLIRKREAELEALKEQRQWAREAAQPKIEPAEKFLLNYLLRLRQREAQYLERAAKGDFAKRVRPKRELSPDVLDAKAKVEAAKQEFHKRNMEFEMARRSKLRKVWDGIKQTKNAFVNIASSYDLSAPRQMFLALLANSSRLVTSPKEGARLTFIPLGRMFKALSSETRSQRLEQWRKTRPNANSGADKIAGVQYTDLHTTDFTRWEENAHSILDEWAALPLKPTNLKQLAALPVKLASKGVRASNRAFITALNTQRAMLFDHLLETNFKDRAPNEAELKTIGNLVNVSTGRGKLSPGVAKATGEILWSPSLFAARTQALIGQPLWGGGPLAGSGRARWIVAKEYARWIVSGAALLATSRLFDDKDKSNLTSSDAGKIIRGKTRIDPWEGFQQPVVLAARIATGKSKSSDTDKDRNITKYGTGEIIWNFFKNKARPDIAAIVKVTIAAIDAGKPAKDVRVTFGEAAKSVAPIPLSVQDIIAVMKDRGMAEGAIVQALSEFGVGVNTYEDKEKQK